MDMPTRHNDYLKSVFSLNDKNKSKAEQGFKVHIHVFPTPRTDTPHAQSLFAVAPPKSDLSIIELFIIDNVLFRAGHFVVKQQAVSCPAPMLLSTRVCDMPPFQRRDDTTFVANFTTTNAPTKPNKFLIHTSGGSTSTGHVYVL
jgi:hypothetical protein